MDQTPYGEDRGDGCLGLTTLGLHIMDLETRDNFNHPTLIVFAALGVLGSLLGTILMFRRRKARVKP
jgi:hypothetical protein